MPHLLKVLFPNLLPLIAREVMLQCTGKGDLPTGGLAEIVLIVAIRMTTVDINHCTSWGQFTKPAFRHTSLMIMQEGQLKIIHRRRDSQRDHRSSPEKAA
jgi:hypothetical protein